MKNLILIALTLIAVSAQAAPKTTCFQTKPNGPISSITIQAKAVLIDWDLSDEARYTKVSGSIVDQKNQNGALTFKTYLMGVGDGSDVQVVIAKDVVGLENLFKGQPAGDAQRFPVVACPN